MTKLTSNISICFVSSNLYEIDKTVSDGHENAFLRFSKMHNFWGFFSMEMIIYTLNIKTTVTWHRDFYGCQGYKKKVITKRKN